MYSWKLMSIVFLIIAAIVLAQHPFLGTGIIQLTYNPVEKIRNLQSRSEATSTTAQNPEITPINLGDILATPGNYIGEDVDKVTYNSWFTVVSSQRLEVPGHTKPLYYVRIRDDYDNFASFYSMEDLSSLIGREALFRVEVRRGPIHEVPRGSVWDPYWLNLVKYKEVSPDEAVFIYIFKVSNG